MGSGASMNVYLLVIDIVLAVAVVYLLLTQKRRGGHFVSSESGEVPAESLLKDSITQLYNRRHLLQRLQENMARAERDKKTLAVVLWDIDGFSDFNNEFGQKEGDRLLQQVGMTLRKAVRVYDEVFRSGDDEFCAILYPADKDISQEVTRRVSEFVSKQLFEGEAEYAKRQFTLSYGYVFYPSEQQSVDSLLYAAQQALYKTKLTQASLN